MHRWAEDGTTCLKHRKFPSQIRLHHRLQQADLSAKLLMHETAISQDNVNLIWHSSDYCLINVTLAQARCISRSVSMEKLPEAQLARTFSIFLCNFLAIKYLFLMRFYCFWHVASERAITPTPSTVGTTSHPDTHLCAIHSPTDAKKTAFMQMTLEIISQKQHAHECHSPNYSLNALTLARDDALLNGWRHNSRSGWMNADVLVRLNSRDTQLWLIMMGIL